MKKLLTVTLACVLMLSLVACGDSSGGEIQEPANVTSTTTQDEQTGKVDEPDATASINETVLVDEAGVKITAKSLETDEIFGPELKLLIENNSGMDLTFQCDYASVNGYMVETMMSVDVVNGKKANDSLTFMASSLDTCGIDTIADMEISFHVFGTADWETYLKTDTIQLRTSIADSFVYTYDDTGNLAYVGNGVKIVIKGLSEDTSIFGPSIVVYVENTSDKDVTVQARDVSINGFMVEPVYSCDVKAGKRAIDTITFLASELEENGITDIVDIELSFHIFDMNDWETIINTDTINISF